MSAAPILAVENLTVRFSLPGRLFGRPRILTAVNDVSFTLDDGETLGIVGESGCGKSTMGRAILRLIGPIDGHVVWQGTDLTSLSAEAMRQTRRDMQIIFQDPIASLDPRMTVGDAIGEPLRAFEPNLDRAAREARILETMNAVGLSPLMRNRYPHEFSGGQAQRIGIARAIVARPRLIVCDEPVSALDVSIQAQIVNLLRDLKARFGLTMIFISHDLSVTRLISNRIMVLYLGRVMERGATRAVFSNPRHPYSQALLSAAPIPDPKLSRARKRIVLQGDPPTPIDPPSGCVFRTRCPFAIDACARDVPALRPVGPDRIKACIRDDLPL